MTFIEIVILCFVVILAICAIKIAFSFKFDVVKWREMKDKKLKEQARMLCTHTSLTNATEKGFEVQSHFVSPFGTHDWICQLCGTRVHAEEQVKRITQHWVENPMAWLKQDKQHNKAVKKLLK